MRRLDPKPFMDGLPSIPASEAHIDEYDYFDMLRLGDELYPEIAEDQEAAKIFNFRKLNSLDLAHPMNCAAPYTSIVDLFQPDGGDLTTEDIRQRLISLSERLRHQPFNHQLFEQTACLLQSLAYHSITFGADPRSGRFIAQGANAGVMNGLFSKEYAPILFPSNHPPLFLLKTAFDKDGDEDTLNEAIVAMNATNKLKSLIPTFMYIYGTFLAPGKLNKVFNSPAYYFRYNMVETIANAQTFRDFIEKMDNNIQNIRRLYEVICQVFLALILAKRETGFIHCDLSILNVMVQKMDERITIPFPKTGLNGETMYVETDIIARIIDFGRSQIPVKLEKETVYTGKHLWELGLYPGKCSSVFDFTRFIGTIEDETRYRNIEEIGFEFLDVLMGPNRLLYHDEHYKKWQSSYFMSPYIGDVDPAEVFHLALPAVLNSFANTEAPLHVSSIQSPSPLFSCFGEAFGVCEPDVAPGVSIPTIMPKKLTVVNPDIDLQRRVEKLVEERRRLKPQVTKLYESKYTLRDRPEVEALRHQLSIIRWGNMNILREISLNGNGLVKTEVPMNENEWIENAIQEADFTLSYVRR